MQLCNMQPQNGPPHNGQPHSVLPNLLQDTEITGNKFTDPDDVDISTLSCDDFVEWLRAKGFSFPQCKAFKGKKI